MIEEKNIWNMRKMLTICGLHKECRKDSRSPYAVGYGRSD